MNFIKICTICLALALVGCSASKSLTLSLNLVEGSEYNYYTTNNSVVNASIMGMDQKTLTDQATEAKYKVISVSPDGKYSIKSTITAMQSSQESSMTTVKYDSKKPAESDVTMAKMMDPMIGHEVTMTMDKQGQITSIAQDNLLEKMFADADEATLQTKPMVEKLFSEESMKQMLGGFSGIYPSQPIKKGESWNIQKQVVTTMTLLTDIDYTLTERKAGKAYVSLSGTVKTDPKAEPMDMMGMKMTYNMIGPITGTLVLDEKTGWTLESKIEQVMKGKMNISGPMVGEMASDMEVVTTSTAKITQ